MRSALLFLSLLGASYPDYCDVLVRAIGGKEIDRYTPPPEVKPPYTVRVFEGNVYASVGFGFLRQPGGVDESEFVELVTRADRKDLRIAEILSVLGEAMHQKPARGPWNAWNYDTLSLPTAIYGLRYFLLAPRGQATVGDRKVSLFEVLPLTPTEWREVASSGREKARLWLIKKAEDKEAMLRRWRLTGAAR
jgi:hypothetical protein